MNANIINRKGRSAKLVALLVTAAMVCSVLALNIGASLAAPGNINESFACESGVPVANHIEVGYTKSMTTFNLHEGHSSDNEKALVSYTSGTSANNLRVTGKNAGVVAVSFGTKQGVINTETYQITDSNNVNAYTIQNGGEVYFTAPGASKNNLVNVTQGFFNRISWRSMNTDVATVDGNGRVSSAGYGVAIIIGSFLDKYGVPRDLHLLVGVGVKLSGSNLGDLLEIIKEGENILTDDPGQWTTDSLHDLEDAVNGGKDVVNSNNPSDKEINGAIKDIQDAINGMDKKPTQPGNVIGPDKDGNYYKPVGDPENVFEVVDQNGNSKQPPEYVYNPGGDPVGHPENNSPAYPKDGSFYVENPPGSNIYNKVNGGGKLKEDPAIWGGPNGMFGGGDDETVYKFGDDYWKDLGQNIWQKVDKNNPKQLDPTLVGGGPDGNPATDPVTPIFKYGDKFFVGPLPPGSNPGYYYGDKQVGGDGKVNSTATEKHPTDDKYYLVNGQMIPEDQLPGVPGLANTPNGEKITIDGMEWTKIKTDNTGKYAMLLLNDFLKCGAVRYDSNSGFHNEYDSAEIRHIVDTEYALMNAPTLKQFAWPVMIGSDDNMSWPAVSSKASGIVMFVPKRSDIQYLTASKREMGQEYWTATRTTVDSAVGYQITVGYGGDWTSKGVTTQKYIRPAIWVAQK